MRILADLLQAVGTRCAAGELTLAAGDVRPSPPRPDAMESRSGGYPRVPPRFAEPVAGRYEARSDGEEPSDRESVLNGGVGRRGSPIPVC